MATKTLARTGPEHHAAEVFWLQQPWAPRRARHVSAPRLPNAPAPLHWRPPLLQQPRPSPLPLNQEGRERPRCQHAAAALPQAQLQLPSQHARQLQHHVPKQQLSGHQLQELRPQRRLLDQRPSQHSMQRFRPSAPFCCELWSAAWPRAILQQHPVSNAVRGRRRKGSNPSGRRRRTTQRSSRCKPSSCTPSIQASRWQ